MNITPITPLEFIQQFLYTASAEQVVDVLELCGDRIARIHGLDFGLQDVAFKIKNANLEQEMADEAEDAMRSYLAGRGL